MKQPTLYYTITSFEQALRYTNNTILFTLRDSKLKLYENLETTLKVMPDSYHGLSTKASVVAKFEIPDVSEKPSELSCGYLTQFGYKYNILKYTIEQKLKRPRTRLLQRVSFVKADDVKTDLSEKAEYIAELRDYKQRVERYTESQTEIVDSIGRVDIEFIDLVSVSYEPLLGGKAGKCKEDLMVGEYGFTLEEWDFIDQTRGAVHKMGLAFTKGLANLGERKVIVPGTEGLAETGVAYHRFLMNAQLLKDRGKVAIDGRPVESIQEHAMALALLSGLDPTEILHVFDEEPNRVYQSIRGDPNRIAQVLERVRGN